ncbi:PAS domain-containing sensor histidine kinase [candidate division Kazan bacterium]|uniref:histidine kinase n=1 Tax=candidate division Kazan bacterium TaxID=2202143 RepID=A0A420ZCB3_UNCK3|nr:MAG: PAS domain-containing sensor histidine kinase [candidate division Kazan bacterium]
MKRKRLLWQLVPTYLAITLGALLLVGWLAAITVHRFYLSQTEADLEVIARLVRQQIKGRFTVDGKSSLDSLSKALRRTSSTRITFINSIGDVLGDSDKDPAEMENHSDRPEFKDAIAGRTGVSIRYSTTLKKRMMYLAIPVESDVGEPVGLVRVSIPLTTIKDALAQVYSGIALGGLLALVLAALFSYIVSRRISNPLVAMKEGAQRFAAGELSHRLTAQRVEELHELATALNKMAVDLDDRIGTIMKQHRELEAVLSSMVEGVLAVDMNERLLKANRSAEELLGIDSVEWQGRSLTEVIKNPDLQWFVSDVLRTRRKMESEIVLGGDQFLQVHGTLLHDAEEREIGALIVMNDITRLRKLENIRRDFAANVSHELRTPITSIKGFVETLQDGAIEDPQSATRFLDIIVKHTDRLNAIIEDLLSLARIEQDAESDRIELENDSVMEVVTTAVRLCEQRASENEIAIEVNCPEDVLTNIAAPLLERAMVNLLDNAINFSEPGGTVQVDVEKRSSEVIVAVKDSGCGIAAEHIPRLFERFYRVDPDRSRKLGGTGLGLAIVKHIAIAHNGRVSVDSQPGQGSTFRIHLPI